MTHSISEALVLIHQIVVKEFTVFREDSFGTKIGAEIFFDASGNGHAVEYLF